MTSTSEIMSDMEQTRADIRATLGAIERRLTVENVVERYVVPTRTQAAEYGRVFGEAVRANPLALGVTAVGIGWLMLGPRRPAPAAAAAVAGSASRGERRLDPSRVGDVGASVEPQSPSAAGAAEAAEAPGSTGRNEALRGAGRRAREAIGQTEARARETAVTAASRVRGAVGRGRDWAAGTSARVGRSAGRAYHATYDAAARAGGEVRRSAGAAGGYAREHPLATGAVLVVGGAALALLLARRSSPRRVEEPDEDVAVMPETPYASGAQADFRSPHRNPTVPLTPEDEEPVYASGDLSSAARPRRSGNGGYDTGRRGNGGGASAGEPPPAAATEPVRHSASVYPAEATTATPDTSIPETETVAEPTATPRASAEEEREAVPGSGGSPLRGARQTGRG